MNEKRLLTLDNVIKNSSWSEDFKGKVVVLSANALKEEFRDSKYQLWYATSGFGCEPDKIGTAVYAMCLDDGEMARWNRGDFIGVYNGELTEEQKGMITKYLEG
jgi:hypothetical protein